MSWQYRLMRRVKGKTTMYYFYEIVEYYVDEDGSTSWTEAGMSPGGESPEECKHDWELMKEAFELPPLDESELESEIAAKHQKKTWGTVAEQVRQERADMFTELAKL